MDGSTSNVNGADCQKQADSILLTGATGVLGGHLLKDLLESTKAKIYCLVRAENREHALQRLQAFLGVYDVHGKTAEAFKNRVEPLLGDIAHPQLELSDEVYTSLADTIDVTIHVAANTNLFATYRRMEPINVGGTQNIIDFCLKTKQKYLCHISTYTVMGDKTFDSSLTFKETDLDVGQKFKDMSYQESKFRAEQLVREATDLGLTWNIIRPGQIYGSSETGAYPQGQTNVSGLFYDIFKTIIETRTALYSQTHFDIVPVDYVSKATLYLGLQRNSFFETYHLTNPDIKSYYEIVRLIADMGYPIEVISIEEYKKMLFEKRLKCGEETYNSVTVKAFKWWFLREQFDFHDGAITECKYTQKILEKEGVVCPKIDHALMKTYIEAGVQQNYFPVPKLQSKGAEEKSNKNTIRQLARATAS